MSPRPNPSRPLSRFVCIIFPDGTPGDRWEPIRRTAPIRKPLLGYYDEANPECVDWQIKWARENGISCFLLDWYWTQGTQHLDHWLNAYMKARYRDQLQIAIMWANHNAPGSNSREDWRRVTQYWIDHVFSLKGYFRIDGKPAIFLWLPENLRKDLGNLAEVKAALGGLSGPGHKSWLHRHCICSRQ